MSLDFNRWWQIKNGKFFEVGLEEEKEIVENFVHFSGTEEIDESKLKSAENEDIFVDFLKQQEGTWSAVFYNAKINKVAFGRDIFGRQSLVINIDRLIFGCRVNPNISGLWMEIPYGQLTIVDVENPRNVKMFTFLEKYSEDVENEYFNGTIKKEFVKGSPTNNLLIVSKNGSGTFESEANPIEFFEIVKKATKNLLRKGINRNHIGICLSGGVDSTFIAHAAQQTIPDNVGIDLINVAFGETEEAFRQAPDRSRSIEALKSLRQKYPMRKFRLILVNIDSKELEKQRAENISQAIRPAKSVLDDSLACVLWFVLRGKGVDYDNGECVESPATTMLLGSGADELLAGYARHRTRFEKEQNAENIAEECEAELRRLGSRNGGRDARIAAQIGKTILSPFLEHCVVSYLNNLSVHAKWDLSLPRGVGEKRLLRETLKLLGSPHTAPKQAMQFGSRLAKMSNNGNSSIKGSDESPHHLS